MVKNADRVPGDKGLSTRHLILVFLAGVAVCGVFFSLGFLVGYNERSARMAPVTERVATSATIPPTVNTPLETTPVGSVVRRHPQPLFRLRSHPWKPAPLLHHPASRNL